MTNWLVAVRAFCVQYDAVLFDNDDVLVEPPLRCSKAEAMRAAFREAGVEDVTERAVDAVASGVTVGEHHEISGSYGVDLEVLWLVRERHDERVQMADFRSGRRGVYDDVAALEELPQVCGVASDNHHSTVAFVLAFFEVEHLFEVHYGREMSVESLELKKPNPHYLERAVADLDAGSALFVGDRESDVIAADRAGLDSVFHRRSHCQDVSLSTEPTYEAQTLAEVVTIATDVRGRA